jgi:hypothetical protein
LPPDHAVKRFCRRAHESSALGFDFSITPRTARSRPTAWSDSKVERFQNVGYLNRARERYARTLKI